MCPLPKSLLLTMTVVCACFVHVHAQTCAPNFQLRSDIATTCAEMSMTMLYDRLGRDFLYVANKTVGLRVYDVSVASSPTLVATLDSNAFGTLDVMNLSQSGEFLYVALGNHFTNPEAGGVAIVDVTNPHAPVVTDYFVVPNSKSGAGMAVAREGFIYLCAMQSGLVILDASNKADIRMVSEFVPDLNYPTPNPDTPKYNVRGVEIVGGLAYLADDAGGLRIINITNKVTPQQIGRYSNPLLNGKPRAYNNVVVNGSLAYVTTDFCGLEVLNVSDPSNITMMGWWNPFDCVGANWFASPIHTNEIRLDTMCKKVFVSAGRTEVVMLDVSNPSAPDSCAAYGIATDDVAAWGLDVYGDKIAFSYVCAVVPFISFRTGVKVLTYTPCTTSAVEDIATPPVLSDADAMALSDADVMVFTMLGELVERYTHAQSTLKRRELPRGVYFEVTRIERRVVTRAALIIE